MLINYTLASLVCLPFAYTWGLIYTQHLFFIPFMGIFEKSDGLFCDIPRVSSIKTLTINFNYNIFLKDCPVVTDLYR